MTNMRTEEAVSTKQEPIAPRPRRPADSAERAYTAIRKLVVDFRFRPDQRINELQLARDLDFSRTPVREALARLSSEGFLVQTPNRGFYFRALATDELVQLIELRSVVESGGFEFVCARASDRAVLDIETFWAMAQERYRNQDPDEILELDETFHLMIIRLAANHELVRSLTAINARIRFIRRVQIQRGHVQSRLIDEHGQVLRALRKRDAATGAGLLRAHISMTIEDAQVALKEVLFSAYMGDYSSP